jgi:hypothetical protein
MCKSDHLFGRNPPNFVCRAPDDIQNSDKIRSLLKDIREVRQAKSREGLQKIDHSELSVGNSIRLVRPCALITPNRCRTYVLWKSMKYDPSSCVPWGYSRTSPAILRPTHDNSVSDYKIPIHLVLQVIYMYPEQPDTEPGKILVPFVYTL